MTSSALAVRVRETARRAPVTALLMAACIAVYAAMLLRGHLTPGGYQFDEQTLLRFGAVEPAAVWTGEWWRMLAAGLVHAGPLHILFNLWALWILGPPLEQALSPWRMAVLLVGTQLGCTASSLAFGNLAVRMGASGMAFGMLGALLVVLWRRRDANAQAGRRVMGTWIAEALIFSLLPGIDLLGHLGGFFAGMALTVGLEPSREHRGDRAISLFFASVLLAVAVRFGVVQPGKASWNAARGFALYRADRCDQALPYLQKAADLGFGDYRPDAVTAAIGDCLLKQGQRDAGIEHLRDAVDRGSGYAALRLGDEEGDPHRTLEDYARALAIDPNDALARKAVLQAAMALAQSGALPSPADVAPLSRLPGDPTLAPVALVRAAGLASGGELGPLRALAAKDAHARAVLDALIGTRDGGLSHAGAAHALADAIQP